MADQHKPKSSKNPPAITPAEADELLDLAAAWVGSRLNLIAIQDDDYIGGHDGLKRRVEKEIKRLREIEAAGREEGILKKKKRVKKVDDAG